MYDTLKLETIIAFAAQYNAVPQHVPADRDLRRVPRIWLINVIYTVIGRPFADWVKARIEERNAAVVDKHNMAIDLDDACR